MPHSLTDIASTLKQIGGIQVNDWDLKGLLNKDIRELEIGRSLQRLGRRKVMEWDFRSALPAVQEFARQEVDVVGWLRRVASYKVIDWDFQSDAAAADPREEMVGRLRAFLMYLAVNLIDEPDRAGLRVRWIAPDTLRFRLVLTAADRKSLVGRDGSTAAAIRGMMKSQAAAAGVNLLLEILSHEEELVRAEHDET
jgi:predicted RNA-binding protein YlqC (UPF0109 family)